MNMGEKFIQGSIKHPGRVHRYIMREFGEGAFTKKGTIKPGFLDKAIERAKRNKELSLERALNEAKTLKELSKERMAYA